MRGRRGREGVCLPRGAIVCARRGQWACGAGEGAWAGVIRAWQVADGRETANWLAHADAILALKVSADGKLLVTAGADKLVKLWDLPGRKELAKLEGHMAQVMAVAINREA